MKLKLIKKYVFICCILLLLYILLYILINYISNIYKKNTYENFDAPKYKTLISKWDNNGFYAELFIKLNHYLYCKKYKINYKTKSANFAYKYKNGWTDYFEHIELKLNNDNDNYNNNSQLTHTENGCCTILEEFRLKDYINIIPEYYKYTPETKNIINNKKKELGLINGDYGCIYIRRGDKLVNEIDFTHTDKFIDKLLNKYPECKTIFLQTDDYNCFIDLQNYIKKHNLSIKPLTLCPENMFGSISNTSYMDKMKNNISDIFSNKEYLDKIKSNLSKPISEMTPEEKYNHTIELITSVDICINSKYCVCDYKSTVSKFIKLSHKNIMRVFDVGDGDKLFNLENKESEVFDIKKYITIK